MLLTLFLSGQTEKLIVPSDMKQQTVVTEPVTLRKGYLRTGTVMDYRVADKLFDAEGNKIYYSKSSWGSQSAFGLTVQYGISDRLEADIFTEYRNNLVETQTSQVSAVTNKTVITNSRQKGIGVGDSRLQLSYQVIPERESRFAMTANLLLTVPTGKKNPVNIKSESEYDLPVGNGTYALGLNITARKVLYPYSFSGYLAYTNSFNGKKIFNTLTRVETRFRLGNLFESGINANLHLNEWIVLGNEVNYYHEGDGRIENQPSPRLPSSWAFSYSPRLIFQVHRFRISESVMVPLKGKNVPADPLYVMTIQLVI
jgi:hypothetical protein